jgi:hypothetical protein
MGILAGVRKAVVQTLTPMYLERVTHDPWTPARPPEEHGLFPVWDAIVTKKESTGGAVTNGWAHVGSVSMWVSEWKLPDPALRVYTRSELAAVEARCWVTPEKSRLEFRFGFDWSPSVRLPGDRELVRIDLERPTYFGRDGGTEKNIESLKMTNALFCLTGSVRQSSIGSIKQHVRDQMYRRGTELGFILPA